MVNEYFGLSLEEVKKDVYKVTGKYIPKDMIVRIKKEGNGYRAICNYSKWTRGAAGPYQAMHLHTDKEQTLKELLMSISVKDVVNLKSFCWVDDKQQYVIHPNGNVEEFKNFKWQNDF